ncbi:GNAT family N-acetyltransferase [Streptomyces sp. NPDC006990]|uniref:GNAT family N-acetyltransferase n=1 Tax=unclassified Streptomyces TaxID=2593676 RepID=UPI003453FD5F
MTASDLRVVRGAALLEQAEALRGVYVDAFCAPPWNEEVERAAEFVARLRKEAFGPGFTAVTAGGEGRTSGFATARTTPARLPAGRCYQQAAAALGAERTAAWLCGAREVAELAVRTAARGTGLAAALLAAVAADAPGGRVWLLTSVRSPRAVSFYRRQGWTQATHPAPEGEGVVVFLGPRHPARSLAALPQ